MFDGAEEPRVEMSQRSLRTSRKVAKASVTRKINEITSLMYAVENVNVIILRVSRSWMKQWKIFMVHMTIIIVR